MEFWSQPVVGWPDRREISLQLMFKCVLSKQSTKRAKEDDSKVREVSVLWLGTPSYVKGAESRYQLHEIKHSNEMALTM